MKYINIFLSFLLFLGKYLCFFLLIYFGMILFLGNYDLGIIQRYFEIGGETVRDEKVFNHRMILRNFVLILICCGLVFSGSVFAYCQIKHSKVSNIFLLLVKTVVLFIFGFFAAVWLNIFDNSLTVLDKGNIKRFIKFWLLGLVVIFSFYISYFFADLLKILRFLGIES